MLAWINWTGNIVHLERWVAAKDGDFVLRQLKSATPISHKAAAQIQANAHQVSLLAHGDD
jgi:hypothetical protein